MCIPFFCLVWHFVFNTMSKPFLLDLTACLIIFLTLIFLWMLHLYSCIGETVRAGLGTLFGSNVAWNVRA